jgi:hypothetical protein
MLFLASAKTLAGLITDLGFSNPNRVWAQALKDDQGTGVRSIANG